MKEFLRALRSGGWFKQYKRRQPGRCLFKTGSSKAEGIPRSLTWYIRGVSVRAADILRTADKRTIPTWGQHFYWGHDTFSLFQTSVIRENKRIWMECNADVLPSTKKSPNRNAVFTEPKWCGAWLLSSCFKLSGGWIDFPLNNYSPQLERDRRNISETRLIPPSRELFIA